MQPESAILRDTLVAVTALPGGMFERMNTGRAFDAKTGRMIQFGTPGGPDIRGVLHGRAVGIECKTANGRQSDEQKRWQRKFEECGGLYVLARSADDALRGLTNQ